MKTSEVVMPVSGGWDEKQWKHRANLEIPWPMISEHDAQAQYNHAGQDLERLASRGGLSACEALAILDNRPWRLMDSTEAYNELVSRIEEFKARLTA